MVSELIQVTELVMSCGLLVPGIMPKALNVSVLLSAGVVVDGVNVICAGVPPLTISEVVAGLTVPKEALMFVVQIPITPDTGLTKPLLLMVAQLVVDQLHETFPVRSFVVPTLVSCFLILSNNLGNLLFARQRTPIGRFR